LKPIWSRLGIRPSSTGLFSIAKGADAIRAFLEK
jgi:hypothetical protein